MHLALDGVEPREAARLAAEEWPDAEEQHFDRGELPWEDVFAPSFKIPVLA